MLSVRCVHRSLTTCRPVASCRGAVLLRRRTLAGQPHTPPTHYQPPAHDSSPENVQNKFAGYTVSAFKDMRRVVVFLAYGTLILATLTGVAYEGTHFWIESKMREGADDDARLWGWDVESWSDAASGGTSPELGIVGRHAARAAWFSLRYGKYFKSTAIISQTDSGSADDGSLNVTDAGLESARIYLEKAMTPLRDESGYVRMDSVGFDLLEKHAAVMERIGTRKALLKARDEFTQVYHGRAGQRLAEARLAVKLGDISERLGATGDALSWWAWGIFLTKDDGTSTLTLPSTRTLLPTASVPRVDTISGESIATVFHFPLRPPSTPAAQRTLVTAMLSLSTHYSKKKQLHEAQEIQEQAIRLIDAMVPLPENSSSTDRVEPSPAQTLHRMYLLHRKSILGVHHGEVMFALTSSKKRTEKGSHMAALMEFLTAASAAEVVAQVLTGRPLSHPDVPSSYLEPKKGLASSQIPHPPSSDALLLTVYRDSPAMSSPAASLLRDSRLAAAEAWDLCGLLYSDFDGAGEHVKALECFERALGWVGDDPETSGSLEGISAKQWHDLWDRFIAAREKVLRESDS